MAAGIIKFNKDTEPMRQAVAALQKIREGRDQLGRARAVMIQYCDGATNVAADFDLLAADAGFQAGDYTDANTAALASFAELDSLYAKLTAGAGQGDSTGAAIDQACAKHNVAN